jgi:serine protease Do
MDNQSRSLLIPVIALSVLLGAFGGGLAGYYTAQYSTPGSGTATPRITELTVEEDSATVKVIEESLPSVVSIVQSKDLSQRPVSPLDELFGFSTPQPEGLQEVSRGTGFIVQSDGMIVTNKHVVSDAEAEYTVILNDEREFSAKVLALDPTNDVAFIDIEGDDYETLALGDSDKVKIGQTVIAIGDPLSFRNSATKGIISGKSRTITASNGQGQAETLEDIFQTDAAINPGNSGGPLIDLAGAVVAVNTAVSQEGQLIGFAIPINVIKRDLESVKKDGKIVRPFLGVRYVLVTKEYAKRNNLKVEHGALIQKGANNDAAVVPGSPADKAGLEENDIILEVEGKKITSERSLVGLLSENKPGDVIKMKVLHDGEEKAIDVTLEERK